MTKWVRAASAAAKTRTTTKTTTTTLTKSISRLIGSSSNWLLTALIIAALAQTTIGFRPIELNSGEGRKLFGGYRITPKHCRATKTLPHSDPRANGPTICMFNHECAQRSGEVVGACMDGFLFGACCQIPHSQGVESTLINDAQNAYYQQHHQHQQQKLQQAISNPAAAQSYETYGESVQQQSQESNKYHEPAQPDIYEQDNLDKVYQQLGSSSRPSSTTYPSSVAYRPHDDQKHRPSSNGYTQKPQQQSAHAAESSSVIAHDHVNDLHEATSSSSQQSSQEPATDSTQSGSNELESDSNTQGNPDVGDTNSLADNPPPSIHVHKHSVKISSPSSPPHNDDFVMQVLSTMPPEHVTDHITFTTEVPMKIASSLSDQTSSESNSFEEIAAITQMPLRLDETPPQTSATQQQDQQQAPKPKPQQQHQSSHNHNHLILDGGQFTHSGITHPGADADLVEDDLQFSTGYGPQPVYVESPGSPPTKTPSGDDKYVLVQTLTNDQANKQPSTASKPTTMSSITTHVDSIESIILQLNNSNHGPAYNVVGQQQTPSYGQDLTSSGGNYYESTTTARPHDTAPTNPSSTYANDMDTKRPENMYTTHLQLDSQKYPSAEAQVAAYLESATKPQNAYGSSSDDKGQLSNNYMQNGYPAAKPESSESSPSQTYTDETAAVLDEHTMPDKNYNDVAATDHQTSEFNKMPAVGIAYPVDMSYLEEEGTLAMDGDEQSGYAGQSTTAQKPVESTTSNTYPKITAQTEPQVGSTYTKLSTASGAGNQHHNQKHPIASYIGVVTSQNYNLQKQPVSVYNQVPAEVSVSSQTTKVEENHYTSSASYAPTQADKLTTTSYVQSSTYTTHPPAKARPSTLSYISSTSAPLELRPQYDSTNGLPSTTRPQLVTASSTKPKPRPKPTSKRPTRRPTSNTTKKTSTKSPSKRPAQPTSSYGNEPQPSNNYQSHKNPAQPSNTYNEEPIYTKRPAAPSSTYNQDATYTQKPEVQKKRPAGQQSTTTKPSKKPSQPSNNYNGSPVKVNRPQPVSTYSQDATTASQDAPQNGYQQAPVVASRPDPPKTKRPASNTYQQTNTKAPAQPNGSYNQNDAQLTAQTGGTYHEHHPAASSPTKRPAASKPSQSRPVSTSYVTGPTTPRPPTTFGYHDNEVPPLLIAADKLDSFVHSTAQSVVGGPTQSTYQAPLYMGAVTPVVVERPQQNGYKKPGFVKVQSTLKPPAPTVLITPKPTVINLVTSTSWTQVPNGGSSSTNDNAYPPTTPIPGFGSTSYIYSPLVTRRPEFASNTPEYVSMSAVTSNDFDDAGYYGAQANQGAHNGQGGAGVHPAFTQATTEATYGVPSDDRPAFPGYYGPTPTYPAFQVPGEKVGSQIDEESYTSLNDFVNFPPVRNPNLNMSGASSAVTTDLELSTPAFVEDVVLKDKMNTLVHKIVESLQGNFDALADMIDDANNTAGSTYHADTLHSTAASTTGTRKPTRKPTRVSTPKPKGQTTRKPSVTRVSTKAPAKKPTTTRKPSSSRPRPATSTRKPTTRRPTKRTTTTTASPAADEIVDEEDEEDVNPTDNEIDQTETLSSIGAGGRKFKCGVRPHVKSGRIVGGKGSTFGAYPWQVLVRESTWLGLFTKNKCGGVLISNRYVITAAHCQPGFLGSLVAVMGEYDISGDLESKRSVTKNVKRVIVHRQYDPATFENDLALLELESTVQFDSHIVPICMPSDNADFTGRMATVTGWGRLKYTGAVPSILQEVQLPIIENSVCQEMFHTAGHNKKILTSFLCAGYANGQKDSCEGDSGGPLVLQRPDGRYELAGTVSHGIKCAAPYLPGVYMRTTFYKPWLRSITGVK